MKQYISTTVGAEDIASYFISLLIIIIIIIIIIILFVCKVWNRSILMYISVNYRLSFFTFILGLQSNSSQTTVDQRNKVFHLHSKPTHPGFCGPEEQTYK